MWHDIAPDAATAVLAAIGALHVAWAFTPWPAPTYERLSKYVYGGPGMPPKQACITVGALLIAAAYGVLAVAGTAPRFGPEGMYRLGVWALVALLLARGVAGPLFSRRGDREFRFWNLAAYSPLCLTLGLGALIALR
jgi:Protein of unknown function (DUF3995)